MTKFYVANGLYHHLDFMANTRAPDSKYNGKYIVNVPIGQQALIGDFPKDEIDIIVNQHKKYGMINVTDLAANLDRSKMIPYIYSIDAPVSNADYAILMDNNFPPHYNYGGAGLWRSKDRISDKTKREDLFA